jgi:hypothetical protein
MRANTTPAPTKPLPVDEVYARRLSAECMCDLRTVRKFLRGEFIRTKHTLLRLQAAHARLRGRAELAPEFSLDVNALRAAASTS